MTIFNFISLLGIPVLICLAWMISADRGNFNWRIVLWGVGLQLAFSAFIFLVPAGTTVFLFINGIVVEIINAAEAGAKFVFGPLALPPGTSEGEMVSLGFVFAAQALPVVIFFAALLALLYYAGVMQFLIQLFSRVFTRWMKISGAESLCVSSNLFVGVESALTVKPYIERMTKSELCTILAAMMGTIASSVMAVYVLMLQSVFHNIAGHLVSASLLSLPAAVLMAKILLPESEQPETLGREVKVHYEREANAAVAVIDGSMAGGKMAFGIAVMLIAVLSLVALGDKITVLIGSGINGALGWDIDFTIRGLLGYAFYPFTLLIGVHPADAYEVARLIGERTVVTELTAYQDLAKVIAAGKFQDPRSAALASYALCGFAHVASVGIFIGGITAIVPQRVKELSEVALRALVAATLGCLMTACAAGVFLTGKSILLG